MRKLDPKIIRVGDTVKIINPVFVIRCGYPLSIKDMKKVVEEKFGDNIDKLIQTVWKGEETDHKMSLANRSKDRAYQTILNELAYVRLKAEKYGGRTRSLHTKILENYKGLEFKVWDIKMCMTGEYVPGCRGNGWDEDSEPAYLTEAKAHKLLVLDYCGPMNEGKWIPLEEPHLKIEVTNVEKIPSVMETPIEYEHRMKQLEKI